VVLAIPVNWPATAVGHTIKEPKNSCDSTVHVAITPQLVHPFVLNLTQFHILYCALCVILTFLCWSTYYFDVTLYSCRNPHSLAELVVAQPACILSHKYGHEMGISWWQLLLYCSFCHLYVLIDDIQSRLSLSTTSLCTVNCTGAHVMVAQCGLLVRGLCTVAQTAEC
jgi:hypothetical protein